MTPRDKTIQENESAAIRKDLELKPSSYSDYIEVWGVIGFEDTVKYTNLVGWLQGYNVGCGGKPHEL